MTDLSPIQISFPYFDSEEQKAVADVLATGWVTQGPKVVEFENKFNALHKVRNSVAVTSCTTGLHLPLAAWGIGPGDEVLVPSFTWITSAHAVVYCGATPVLVDVDRSTYNIDIKDVAGQGHGAHQGDHPGPPLRPLRRHGRAQGRACRRM